MEDLQTIDGVGPSYAEELAGAGYEDAEAVAEADPDDIDRVADTLNGASIVESAQSVIDDGGDESKSESASDDSEEYYEIDLDLDEDQRNHFIRALVREEVRARRRNDASRAESIRDSVQEVIDGTPYEFTMQQLDASYTAINQLEAEYRGTRGLGSFTTKIRTVKDAVKDERRAHWDE